MGGVQTTAGKIKFSYFPLKARGFPILLALEVGKVDYEAEVVTFEAWQEMKKSGVCPMGYLPLIELPDGTRVNETNACLMAAGLRGNLLGSTESSKGVSAMLACKSAEVFTEFAGVQPSMFTVKDWSDDKLAALQKWRETCNVHMEQFEKLCSDDGKFTADGNTIGELSVFHLLFHFQCCGFTTSFPTKLQKFYDRLLAMPEVKKCCDNQTKMGELGNYFVPLPSASSVPVTSVGTSVAACVGSRPMVNRMGFVSKEDIDVAQSFKARAGDVFISTYPKTGTTYLQQVCHQLRTGGHIEFEEISEEGIVPWLEVSPSILIDNNLDQTANPRCFKTHQRPSALAHLAESGGKLLCTVRNPESTAVSFFKFILSKGQLDGPMAKDVNLFIKSARFLGAEAGEGDDASIFGGTCWDFYAEMWKVRHLPNVKLYAFEHITKDLDSKLDEINSFLGLGPLDLDRRAKVLEYCHKDWMMKNDHLFDDHHRGPRLAKKKGKGDGKGLSKASPKVGLEVAEDVVVKVNDESKALLEGMWRKHMLPVTGHESYAEMIMGL